MFNKFSTLLLAFCLAFTLNLSAQISSATINYGLKMEGNVDPQMAMLQATTAALSFKDDKLKLSMNMMGMINVQAIVDHKLQNGITLIDMMGNKSSMVLDKTKYKELNQSKDLPDLQKTTVTKEFAGYKTVAYKLPNNEATAQYEAEITMFLSTEVMPKNKTTLGHFFGNIAGIPLAIEVKIKDATYTLYAKDIDKTELNKNAFSTKVPKDYPEKSGEEILNMFNSGM